MLFMLLVLIAGGYLLMFLFIKYYEKKYIYYIVWYLHFSILSSISAGLRIDIWNLTEIEQYLQTQFQEDTWMYYIVILLLVIPSLYIIYPILLFIYHIIVPVLEIVESIIYIPISNKRMNDYFDKKNKDTQDEKMLPLQ